MRIASVVGARPNFVKLAPIHKSLSPIVEHTIIHTGQHYDFEMSEIFFKEFNLPAPNFNLDVGSGTPGFQIGEMVKRIEKTLMESHYDTVVVYGDTNSTFAGALAAVRLGIPIAHVESGLRSFDRSMPEEINRVLTDQISNHLFAPTLAAVRNLERENAYGKITYTGDISVEVVRDAVKLVDKSRLLKDLYLDAKAYLLLTMHRAENTNSASNIISIIRALESLSEITIVFPIHPRTARVLKDANLYSRLESAKNVRVIQPLGYLDFMNLLLNAAKVITDSGGIQKEAYLLSVPCITIRNNTEWTETVTDGWNVLVGTDFDKIIHHVRHWLPVGKTKPIFGDGSTSSTISNTIMNSTLNKVAVS